MLCTMFARSIMEVTHAQETCTRNLHGIEQCSIRCKFLVQVSSSCVTSITVDNSHKCADEALCSTEEKRLQLATE